jgi:hypothetical protein
MATLASRMRTITHAAGRRDEDGGESGRRSLAGLASVLVTIPLHLAEPVDEV